MAMVVQHNLTAMNANRQLGVTTGGQAKSAEKLSSGYRINRAGDDAAGLKISEKMRSQVRGLTKASSNAQDGVSLIQTAEGALNEAHSILQRMNELAVQGANDTNENIDRDAINEELDALTTELDRIASTTQFNKQNLLDGTFTDKNLQVGANSYQNISISIDKMNADSLGLRDITKVITHEKQTGTSPKAVKYENLSVAYATTWSSKDLAMSEAIGSFSASIIGTAVFPGSDIYTSQFNTDEGKYFAAVGDSNAHFKTAGSALSHDMKLALSEMKAAVKADFGKYVETTNGVASNNKVNYSAANQQVSVDNYDVANDSIVAIQNAINKVSSQRSALGALQNRLEHTIANLDNVAENTQSAESRIRDTDMASEMVEYSKNNILAQAGQSMLAQANQSTQGVLSLLQ